jgi:hypothetical protein
MKDLVILPMETNNNRYKGNKATINNKCLFNSNNHNKCKMLIFMVAIHKDSMEPLTHILINNNHNNT